MFVYRGKFLNNAGDLDAPATADPFEMTSDDDILDAGYVEGGGEDTDTDIGDELPEGSPKGSKEPKATKQVLDEFVAQDENEDEEDSDPDSDSKEGNGADEVDYEKMLSSLLEEGEGEGKGEGLEGKPAAPALPEGVEEGSKAEEYIKGQNEFIQNMQGQMSQMRGYINEMRAAADQTINEQRERIHQLELEQARGPQQKDPAVDPNSPEEIAKQRVRELARQEMEQEFGPMRDQLKQLQERNEALEKAKKSEENQARIRQEAQKDVAERFKEIYGGSLPEGQERSDIMDYVYALSFHRDISFTEAARVFDQAAVKHTMAKMKARAQNAKVRRGKQKAIPKERLTGSASVKGGSYRPSQEDLEANGYESHLDWVSKKKPTLRRKAPKHTEFQP